MAEKRKASFMGNVAAILGSQVVIKLIGFAYNLVLINLPGFGDLGNGYRAAGYQFYTMLLAISSVGIPNAISKLISERLALDDRAGAERVFKTAMRLFAGIGLAGTLLLYWGADFIALRLVRMNGVQYTLRALSPSIFFVCISSVIRGYFLGRQNVRPNNRSQLLEQIFKAVLTILFVTLLSDTTAAVMAAGANAATAVSTAFSCAYLIIVLITFRKKSPFPQSGGGVIPWTRTAKQILSLSIPISLSSIITTVARVIDTATISRGIARAFAQGIPGSVGGAVVMNAGAYGRQISDILVSSRALTPQGMRVLTAAEHRFGYRHSIYQEHPDWILTSARFHFIPTRRAALEEQMADFAQRRRASQPLEYPSAGSVFKRPEGHFAGQLIERCGLKGYRIGDAQVSEKHAGFIVNRGEATCAQVLELMEHIQKTVLDRTGVRLEPEIRVLK